MSSFEAYLSVEKVAIRPKPLWRLNRDLVYYSSLLSDWVRVPKGFVTDFASVPRLPIAFLLTGGKGDEAAVVHDWLYSTRTVSREVADGVFEEALRLLGYSATTVSLMYTGVRAGGWVAWKRENVPQSAYIQAHMDRMSEAP